MAAVVQRDPARRRGAQREHRRGPLGQAARAAAASRRAGAHVPVHRQPRHYSQAAGAGKQREPLLRIAGPGAHVPLPRPTAARYSQSGSHGDDHHHRQPAPLRLAAATTSGWISASTTPARRRSRPGTTRPRGSYTVASQPRADRDLVLRQRTRGSTTWAFTVTAPTAATPSTNSP